MAINGVTKKLKVTASGLDEIKALCEKATREAAQLEETLDKLGAVEIKVECDIVDSDSEKL